MTTTAVTRRAQRSTACSRWKAEPAQATPALTSTAKTTTGRPVPIPYSAGSQREDRCSRASGMRPPKKSPAETGQKARARTAPSGSAPTRPAFDQRCPVRS